jgi:2-C-methyl-D-erythritol 4-phosphate cytidylyltransferase/2-C-methyl-D-erythritol 2,4-cyclodiphosphate synthase
MTSSKQSSPQFAAILLAAGSGSRSGGDQLKQLRALCGKPVLVHSLDALRAHPRMDDVVVVAPPTREDELRTSLGERAHAIKIVSGGASRRLSVRAGLEALTEGGSTASYILVHDSARPTLPVAVIDRLLDALDAGSQAAIPVLPVTDTLVLLDGAQAGDVVNRDALARVQTPQAFNFQALRRAHEDWTSADEPTDDAQMVRGQGYAVALVPGDISLEKITWPGDHDRMERHLTAAMRTVTGMGFDVHRLVPGKELWLCGTLIPHDHGLSGHSDADVAIHALVDAILGALAEGDIGSHFPPSDPQWKGASSDQFLAFARDRVAARGGVVDHVDVTIICEAPKIGPHRDAMRDRLAQILQIGQGWVSVKATTTERLGLTGRKEGIAAQAVASLRVPISDSE